MTRVVLSTILFVGAALIPGFGQQIGQVVYIQASVEIVDLDTVQTGDDGQPTISTNPSSGVSSAVNVGPDTTFTFDLGDESNPDTHAIDLMDGTLSMALQALAGSEITNVDAGSAVMGIRGTNLELSAAASGDVLLTVDEGKVACTTEEGKTLYDQPRVVVQDVNDSWDDQPVPVATLSTFRRTWRANRVDYLSAHADEILQRLSASYLQERSRLSDAYDRLMENRAAIDRWLQAERAGTLFRQEFEQIRSGVGGPLCAPPEPDSIRAPVLPTAAPRGALPQRHHSFHDRSRRDELRSVLCSVRSEPRCSDALHTARREVVSSSTLQCDGTRCESAAVPPL